MSKFFVSLTDSENYSDNRFGHLISCMLKDAQNDAIVLFRKHAMIVTFDKEEQNFEFRLHKIHENSIKTDLMVLDEIELYKGTHNCHKYIGYILMREFRNIHEDLKKVNFPVDEFKVWFDYDLSSYIYFNDEDESPIF